MKKNATWILALILLIQITSFSLEETPTNIEFDEPSFEDTSPAYGRNNSSGGNNSGGNNTGGNNTGGNNTGGNNTGGGNNSTSDAHCLILNNATINQTNYVTVDLVNTCSTAIMYPGINASSDNSGVEGLYDIWWYVIGENNTTINMGWQLLINQSVQNGTVVTLYFAATVLNCGPNNSWAHDCPTSTLSNQLIVLNNNTGGNNTGGNNTGGNNTGGNNTGGNNTGGNNTGGNNTGGGNNTVGNNTGCPGLSPSGIDGVIDIENVSATYAQGDMVNAWVDLCWSPYLGNTSMWFSVWLNNSNGYTIQNWGLQGSTWFPSWEQGIDYGGGHWEFPLRHLPVSGAWNLSIDSLAPGETYCFEGNLKVFDTTIGAFLWVDDAAPMCFSTPQNNNTGGNNTNGNNTCGNYSALPLLNSTIIANSDYNIYDITETFYGTLIAICPMDDGRYMEIRYWITANDLGLQTSVQNIGWDSYSSATETFTIVDSGVSNYGTGSYTLHAEYYTWSNGQYFISLGSDSDDFYIVDNSTNGTNNTGGNNTGNNTGGNNTTANTAPQISSVVISPSTPLETDVLTCSYVFTDADNDPDESIFVWTVNGATVTSVNSVLTSGYVAGDFVTCAVLAYDGMDYGNIGTSTVLIMANSTGGSSNTSGGTLPSVGVFGTLATIGLSFIAVVRRGRENYDFS